MSKKNKKPKYNPTGKYIGLDTGFVQAAVLLDMAALDAIESRDYKRAADIARQWIELSMVMKNTLAPPEGEDFEGEEHDHESGSDHPAGPIGFGVTAAQLKEHHGRTNK
jgi:hypothetical protein